MSLQSRTYTSMTCVRLIGALAAAGLVCSTWAPASGQTPFGAQVDHGTPVQRTIDNVRVFSDEGGVRVTFCASTPLDYTKQRMADPDRLVLAFPEARLADHLTASPVLQASGKLAKVLMEMDRTSPTTAKAILYVRENVRIRTGLAGDRKTLVVTLGAPGAEPDAQASPTADTGALAPPAPIAPTVLDLPMIQTVAVERQPGVEAPKLCIRATKPVRFQKKLRGAGQLAIDIQEALVAPEAPSSVPVFAGGIGEVTLAQLSLSPAIVRVGLELEANADYLVTSADDGRTVVLDLTPLPVASSVAQATPPALLGTGGVIVTAGPVGELKQSHATVAGPARIPSYVVSAEGAGDGAGGPETVLPDGRTVVAGLDSGAGTAPGATPAPAPMGAADVVRGVALPSALNLGGIAVANSQGVVVDPADPAGSGVQVNFSETPLRSALTMFAFSNNENIIVDETVEGTISMTMGAINFEEALGVITMMKGLAWKKVGDTYVVATKEKIQEIVPPGSRTVRTYQVTTLTAEGLANLLGKLHPSVYADPQEEAGVVVLVGQEDEVAKALETLRSMDGGDASDPSLVEPQATGAAKIRGGRLQLYKLTGGADAERVKAALAEVFPADQLTVRVQADSSTLVLEGSPSKVREAVAVLPELEARVADRKTATYEPGKQDITVVQAAVEAEFTKLEIQALGNVLLLRGPSSVVDAAVEYARQVDLAGTTWYEVVMDYEAKTVAAASLASLAAKSYPSCRFDFELATNRVVAMGPAEDVTKAVEDLAKWDTESAAATIELQYSCKFSDSLELAAFVEELDVGVTATAAGTLVNLEGPPAKIEQVLAALETQDKPIAQKPKSPDVIEVVQLDHVDVEYAYESTKNFFQAAERGSKVIGRGGVAAPAPAAVPTAPAGTPGAPSVAPGAPSVAPGVPEGTAAEIALGRQLVVVADTTSHRITLVGPKTLVDRARALLDEIDVPQHQVTLHAMIVDMDRTLAKDVGTQWNFGLLEWQEHGARAPWGREPGANESEEWNSGIAFSALDRGRFQFQSLLNFVQSDTRAKLLARPNVKALDGKQATVQIGDELRFQTVQLQGTTNQPLITIETVDVGIILEFTPRIANDGTITAIIRAESSTIASFVEGIPQLATRQASTEVRLEDRQTMVIAGLIREEETETIEKLPILSSIPFFGRLFKNRRVSHRPQELIVFLTPEIEYAQGDKTLRAEAPVF